MEVSFYINEILFQDHRDLTHKYIITSTKSLKSRVLEQSTWECIKKGQWDQVPAKVIKDLAAVHILVPQRHPEREWQLWQQMQDLQDTMNWRFDLSKTLSQCLKHLLKLNHYEGSAWHLLAPLKDQGVQLLDIHWEHFDLPTSQHVFLNLSHILRKAAERNKILVQGRISTRRPHSLPAFQDLDQVHYISEVQIILQVGTHHELLKLTRDHLHREFKKGPSTLTCQLQLQIPPQHMEEVASVMQDIRHYELQELVQIQLVPDQSQGPWSRPLKAQYAQQEIPWLQLMEQLGLPLPPLGQVANKVLAALTSLRDTPCSHCQILPLCGGYEGDWQEDWDPCPSSRWNFKEKVLLANSLPRSGSGEKVP